MTAEELRASLTASRERLLDAIRGVTEEQFKKRPPDGGWCIAEVLAHQLISEKLFAGRIRLALDQDGAPVVPADPEQLDAQVRAGRVAPVPQLIHGLLATRREVEKLLDEAATINGALDRAVLHPQRGRQTVAFMFSALIAAHEAEHIAQIEDLKALVAP